MRSYGLRYSNPFARLIMSHTGLGTHLIAHSHETDQTLADRLLDADQYMPFSAAITILLNVLVTQVRIASLTLLTRNRSVQCTKRLNILTRNLEQLSQRVLRVGNQAIYR